MHDPSAHRTTTSRRMLIWLMAALPALPVADLAAQNYAYQQRLTAPAVGEGEPGGHFGIKVVVDGDLAVVADRPEGGVRVLLRAYRRIAGVWQRAPELTIQHANRTFVDMALDQGRLVYTTDDPAGGRTVHAKDAESDGWDSEFGIFGSAETYGDAVAVAGDRVVIGIPGTGTATGSVSVRTRANDGTWSSTTLSPPSHPGARFGSSVGIVAGAVVVGAPGEDIVVTPNTRSDAGAAYVFELTQSTWSQVARFTAATPENTGHFGASVAISGTDPGIPEAILVGAPREAGTDGAVYVYKRGASVWALTMHMDDPPSPQTFQQFGSAVALDAGYALIGSNTYAINGVMTTGAVYGVDFNSGFTDATLTLRSDPLAAQQDRLGTSLAIDRDGPTVFVGSPDADLHGNNQQGIVLTSRAISSAAPFPALARTLDIGQGLSYAGFGTAVDADADRLLVGAPYENVGNLQAIGAAYLYRRNEAGNYELEARLQSPNAAPYDLFGWAVAVAGDSIIIGAIGRDQGGQDTGIAYAFRRIGGVWQNEAQLTHGCASIARRHFGRRIAFDGTRAQIGGVCPFEGGPGLDLGTRIFVRANDGTWSSSLVEDISRLGGGGWDNGLAVMGIPVNNGADNNFGYGAVYTFLPDGSDWTQVGSGGIGTGADQGYGQGIAVENGTLVVTSAASSYPVNVYRRNGNTYVPDATLIANDLGADDPTQAVAIAGNRIAFGAHRHTVSLAQQGAVYLFEKQAGMWVQRQKLLNGTPQAGANFGAALALASDGLLFVGSANQSVTFDGQGAVYVYSPPSDVLLRDGFE